MMFHLKCLSFVIACLPDMCQLEDCLVSKTISLCQVLSSCLWLVTTTNHFDFSACWGLDFLSLPPCLPPAPFPPQSGSFEISSVSQPSHSIIAKKGRRREDLGFPLLECLIVYHLTLMVPPSLDLWASSQEDLTQQFFYWPLCRVLLPGDRDAFQPEATEHLTLRVSSGLWIGKGLC